MKKRVILLILFSMIFFSINIFAGSDDNNETTNNIIICDENSDCDDNNVTTEDICHNPGSFTSFCTNEPIACFTNSDCGTNDFVDEPFCTGNNVTRLFETFTCNNPGTSNSSCTSDITSVVVEECPDYCEGGACHLFICESGEDCDDNNQGTEDICLNPSTPQSSCSNRHIECFENIDCGIDGFFGSMFCSENDVSQGYRTYICNNAGTGDSFCSLHSESRIVTQCEDNSVCVSGACVEFQFFVNSPTNSIYNQRRISFNLTSSIETDEISYIDWSERRPQERVLCNNCEEYGNFNRRLQLFSEGVHNLDLIARKNNVMIKNSISFLVDSRAPRISSTEPRARMFSNGVFYIVFREEHLVNLSVHYRSENITRSSPFDIQNDCVVPERNKYLCEKHVDLSDLNGEQIRFWFSLIDIAGNSDFSNPTPVNVDTVSPIVNNFNYSINGRRVTFYFTVSELNFDEINYKDLTESNPRERSLCTRLRNGVCEVSRSFRTGQHNLQIKVLDEAGNFEQENILFVVV